MRPRLVIAFTALAALAACDRPAEPKGAGSARAVIGAQAPAAANPAPGTPAKASAPAVAANCPTVAPACPPPAARKASRHDRAGRAARHAAHAPKAKPSAARRYAKAETTVGLPPRPYRYDELEPARPRHHGRHHAPHAHAPSDEGYEEARRHHRGHDAERGWKYDDERRYEGRRDFRRGRDDEAYEGRHAHVRPAPGPYVDREREHVYRDGHFHERRSARTYGYAESGSSYSEHRSASSSYVEDRFCDCGPGVQAAGFDSRGFLTWPGKTPAR